MQVRCGVNNGLLAINTGPGEWLIEYIDSMTTENWDSDDCLVTQ